MLCATDNDLTTYATASRTADTCNRVLSTELHRY